MASNNSEPGWMKSLYDELYQIAERALASERPGHSLQPTLLVNDACLKLMEQRNLATADRLDLLAAGARIIRWLLVDYSRKRKAKKRGEGKRQALEMEIPDDANPVDVSLLHEGLEALSKVHPRAAIVVELKFFGGMSNSEVAEFLQVGLRTVTSDWTYAKGWLGRFLSS